MRKTKQELFFCLGGADLEMLEIRQLLQRKGARFADHSLSWGASTADYDTEIEEAMARGLTPVLVELRGDLGLGEKAIIVDHHDDLAGLESPSALEQVFSLLACNDEEWSRWYTLVAANDKGHVAGLKAVGATATEIRAVREADLQAQGVSQEERGEARDAVDEREVVAGGRLTVVRQQHSRAGLVVDLLEKELGGPGFENLLVQGGGEVNFYGDGRLVQKLRDRFGGWSGGALPERGFWGGARISGSEVQEFVLTQLREDEQRGKD